MTWLADLEDDARAILPDHVYRYFSAVAGDGQSNADAEALWDALRFRPHVFGGSPAPSTRTTVLGMPIETPVLVAPLARQSAAASDAEIAAARAARHAGSVLGVAMSTSVRFEAIADEEVPWWFQVYPLRDRGLTEAIAERAAAAGACALILTTDGAELRADGFPDESGEGPDSPARTRLANLLDEELDGLPNDATAPAAEGSIDLIETLRERTGLDVLVKGILRGDDAARATDAGATGVIVSTHGGRRLGRSISSIAALPDVLDAVGSRSEVFVDSGIRSGEHVAAALALGARAVFVGRPLLWGLATGGAAGAAEVLARLGSELEQCMGRLGAGTIADLSPDLLA